KSYGLYDMNFLQKEILPNVTTLIIANNLQLSDDVVKDWHRQGKRFVAEGGINSQIETAADPFKYWRGFFDRTPFLDGIIIDEFIVNYPMQRASLTPERKSRWEHEKLQYEHYSEALKQLRADAHYSNKLVYTYVGGSGKKLNQEVIGTNLVRTV